MKLLLLYSEVLSFVELASEASRELPVVDQLLQLGCEVAASSPPVDREGKRVLHSYCCLYLLLAFLVLLSCCYKYCGEVSPPTRSIY